MKNKYYNSYPLPLVMTANLLSLLIYLFGLYIISFLGKSALTLFAFYILWLEYRVLSYSCRNCCYYGKLCAFGKGKLCALFFKKGNPKIFAQRTATWKDILPDFLVFLIPFTIGNLVLLKNFNLHLSLSLLALFLLSFFGTPLIRGKLSCKYCKQRERGCPAEKLFRKK